MSSYYIAREGNATGPFEESEIRAQLEQGILTGADQCWREGMADWQTLDSVLVIAANPPPPPLPVTEPSQLFLYIPVTRLILMSILTMGLYELYWFFRNWQCVKKRHDLKIISFWRAIFAIFFCHRLFCWVHDDSEARSLEILSFSPGWLAAGWILSMLAANAVSRLPGDAPIFIAAFIPSFLFLVPVQKYVNSVNKARNPNQPYFRWSVGHIIFLIVGVLMWVVALVPAEAEA